MIVKSAKQKGHPFTRSCLHRERQLRHEPDIKSRLKPHYHLWHLRDQVFREPPLSLEMLPAMFLVSDPIFRICHKVIITKAVRYLHKDRKTGGTKLRVQELT